MRTRSKFLLFYTCKCLSRSRKQLNIVRVYASTWKFAFPVWRRFLRDHLHAFFSQTCNFYQDRGFSLRERLYVHFSNRWPFPSGKTKLCLRVDVISFSRTLSIKSIQILVLGRMRFARSQKFIKPRTFAKFVIHKITSRDTCTGFVLLWSRILWHDRIYSGKLICN